MFSYDDFVIKSSVPLSNIASYLREIGANELSPKQNCGSIQSLASDAVAELVYEYSAGGSEPLEITITIGVNEALKMLNMPMHTIRVSGSGDAAKKLLDGFRLKFLSAGG